MNGCQYLAQDRRATVALLDERSRPGLVLVVGNEVHRHGIAPVLGLLQTDNVCVLCGDVSLRRERSDDNKTWLNTLKPFFSAALMLATLYETILIDPAGTGFTLYSFGMVVLV